MKKVIYFAIVLLLTFSFAFSFFACDTNTNTNGTGSGEVSVSLTKNDYKKVFKSVSDSYDEYYDSLSTPKLTVSLMSIQERDFIDTGIYSQLSVVDSCIWLIRFSKNLCDNPSFVLTSDPQQCIIHDSSAIEHHIDCDYYLKFTMSFDSQTNTVFVRQYCEQSGSTTFVYGLTFEIVYDFTTDTLGEFSIIGVMGAKDNLKEDDVQYYKFKNGTLKYLDHRAESFSSFSENAINDAISFAPVVWETELADYSTEYLSAEPKHNS